MFKEKLTQKVRETKRDMKRVIEGVEDGLAVATAIGALYLGATIAVNAIAVPVILGVNGLERAIGGKQKQQTITLVEKGAYNLVNGGNIAYGRFRTDDGAEITLADACDFPSYNFLPNRNIPRAEVGKKYSVRSLQGPASSKILDMHETSQ